MRVDNSLNQKITLEDEKKTWKFIFSILNIILKKNKILPTYI